MKNREALFPNRVKFTDENTGNQYIGTWDYADSPTQEGTKLTADVFLSNENASAFDIESDDPTPNEVFTALSAHAARHALGGIDPFGLRFGNVSVSAAAFATDTTYEDFGYRAAVSLTGVTSEMVPEVVFDPTDAISGIFAPVAACYAGGVYIYASEVPGADFEIPTIIIWKVVD